MVWTATDRVRHTRRDLLPVEHAELARVIARGCYVCRCDICNEPIWEHDRFFIDKHPEVGDLAICRTCTGHTYDD